MARLTTLSFPASNTQLLLSTTVAGGGATPSIPLNKPYPFVFVGLARTITLTSTDNLSGVNFTITGTDQFGNAIGEVLAGPNNNTVTSNVLNPYHTITNISSNGAYTNFSIGSGSTGTFQWFKLDNNNINFQMLYSAQVVGTINYSVVVTNSQLEYYTAAGPSFIYNVNNNPVSFSAGVNLANATTSQSVSILFPLEAIQTIINSSTGGSLIINILQQGL